MIYLITFFVSIDEHISIVLVYTSFLADLAVQPPSGTPPTDPATAAPGLESPEPPAAGAADDPDEPLGLTNPSLVVPTAQHDPAFVIRPKL